MEEEAPRAQPPNMAAAASIRATSRGDSDFDHAAHHKRRKSRQGARRGQSVE